MQITDMYIRMEGMKFYAFHGVLPQENLVGANFYIDLKLKTDFTRAAETDELAGTVSYADIHTVVKEEMKIPSKLLEHVCQRIARRLFHDFPTIETIDISLFKENPPMGACAKRVGVEASYRRSR
jgi:dihydroneopterin aldolase